MRGGIGVAERDSKTVAERVAASRGLFDRAAARETGLAQEIDPAVEPAAEASQRRNHRIRRGDVQIVHLRLVVRHFVHRIRLPQGCCFHHIPHHWYRTGRYRSSHTRCHNRFGRSLPMMLANHGVCSGSVWKRWWAVTRGWRGAVSQKGSVLGPVTCARQLARTCEHS